MHPLPRKLLIPVFFFVVFPFSPTPGIASELDIHWSDKKLSIKAKDVILCELMDALAEKTNTQIHNDNKCDYPISLNIDNLSFDEAIKKIFRGDSYVLVDDDTERKLLVYNRNSGQSDSNSGAYDPRSREPIYIPEASPPDPYNDPGTQGYGQYEDTNAMNRGGISPDIMEPDLANIPEPPPYPTDPTSDPDSHP